MIQYLSAIICDGEFVGIWFPTYKDLSEVWTDLKKTYKNITIKKDEQLHQIVVQGGGKIDFWSMEDPDSGQGRKYHRAIVDEAAKAKKFKEAWNNTIRPTLTDYIGDAFIFSRPKGKANYFYTLEKEMKQFDNWGFFHFTSYDNPFLSKSEIDEARMQLDQQTFDQEYNALYVDLNDKPFLYNFDEKKHVKKLPEINPHLPLWISNDFNIDPMTFGIGQRIDYNTLHVIDERTIRNSDVYGVCDVIKSDFPGYNYTFTGDASGRNRNQGNRGARSNWMIIKSELKVRDAQFQIRSKNLTIDESRILCNSLLENANIFIDPRCEKLIEDCREARIEEKPNGKIELLKDESTSGMHHLDHFRYMLDANFPDFISNANKYRR